MSTIRYKPWSDTLLDTMIAAGQRKGTLSRRPDNGMFLDGSRYVTRQAIAIHAQGWIRHLPGASRWFPGWPPPVGGPKAMELHGYVLTPEGWRAVCSRYGVTFTKTWCGEVPKP